MANRSMYNTIGKISQVGTPRPLPVHVKLTCPELLQIKTHVSYSYLTWPLQISLNLTCYFDVIFLLNNLSTKAILVPGFDNYSQYHFTAKEPEENGVEKGGFPPAPP